ncbi:acyltransferase [Phytohabitans sp. ZYX-F-186]|uniref:Acyltransferase n=1 Tax=Phytohabitans maris TaxID=3071409 RepID=A0ABU0ZRT3_9ACTN|nr:acyltransferase [Phytohabitans sp. ZYX-F-186]MDQ7909734.1 acyltransferase [Phytohabitans sp. ZYX-F-186]
MTGGVAIEMGADLRSANRDYLASVDHLRAFAALLIVFYHGVQLFSSAIRDTSFNSRTGWLYSSNPVLTFVLEGHTAVALFMVLSGFIFTVGTLDREVSWSRFMANRLLRIYPMFVLLLVIGIAANPDAFSLSGLAQAVLGLGNLPGGMMLGDVSGMFWAVAVEMQFYLVFPLLNRLLTRFGISMLVRLFAAIVVVRGLVWAAATTHDAHRMLYLNIAGRIDQFLLGMIAAWLFVRYRDRFRGWWKTGIALALAIVTLWAFNQAHGFHSNEAWRLAWVDVEGGVWALVILTYAATCRGTSLPSRVVAKVGETSYSIYLLHFLVVSYLADNGYLIELRWLSPIENALLTTAVIVVPVVLAISALTYQSVEQPFLRMRIKYLLPVPPPSHRLPPADRSDRAVPQTPRGHPEPAALATSRAASIPEAR